MSSLPSLDLPLPLLSISDFIPARYDLPPSITHLLSSLPNPSSVTLYQPLTLAILVGLAHLAVFWKQTRHTFWNYRNGKARVVLSLHLTISILELLRFHLTNLSHPPTPQPLDLLLCLLHSLTSLIIARPVRKGSPTLVRASYQADALLRFGLSLLAFLAQHADPGSPYPSSGGYTAQEYHRASLLIVHGFVYTRGLVYLYGLTGALRKYGELYSMGVFVSGILVVVDGPIREGEKVYVCAVAGVAGVNWWVTSELERGKVLRHSLLKRLLLEGLAWAGFADVETIQERARGEPGSYTNQPAHAVAHLWEKSLVGVGEAFSGDPVERT